jgi:hypothetical protein
VVTTALAGTLTPPPVVFDAGLEFCAFGSLFLENSRRFQPAQNNNE